MSSALDSDDRLTSRTIRCPALVLALALASGIALGNWLQLSTAAFWRVIPLLIAASAASLLVAALLLRNERDGASTIAVLAGFALAGGALPILFAYRLPPNHVSRLSDWGIEPDRAVQIEGRVLTEPVTTPSGLEFDLAATRLAQRSSLLAENLDIQRNASGIIRLHVDPLAAAGGGAVVYDGRHEDETIKGGNAEAKGILGVHPGDFIAAAVTLRRPHVYKNPGSFDFRKRAAEMEDLYWDGSIAGASEIRSPATASVESPSRFIWRVRLRVRRGIDRLYPPWSPEGRDGAVLKAILLGDRSSLDSVTVDHFRASGLYHLLVIAGLHVGLMAGIVLGFLRLLGLSRTWRNVLLLVILLAYSLLVEQRAPTLRATLMIVAFVVADLLNRDHAALNSVGVAALILLLARPLWLFESGFQLSFSAALLIVGLAAPILRLTIEPYHRALAHLDNVEIDAALRPGVAQFRLDLRAMVSRLRSHSAYLDGHPVTAIRLIVWPLGAGMRLIEIVILSAVLQIGLLLPMVETFHRVTLAGIGLNSLAVPLMAVLLAIAIPTVSLATVAPAWTVVPGKILAVVFKALFWLAEFPHLPDWLSYRIPPPPAAVALGFALSLIALAVCLGRRRTVAIALASAFAVFAVLLATEPFAADLPSGAIELTALDCGRGRSSLVVLPDQSTLLIGAGGAARAGKGLLPARWDPGENIVAPYLWSRRVKNIDVLMAPDANLDGIGAVLDDFHVRELWLGPVRRGSSAAELAAIARSLRRGTILRPIASGETLQVAGSTVEFTSLSGAATDSESGGGLTVRITGDGHSTLIGPVTGENALVAHTDIVDIDRPDLSTAAQSGLLSRTGAQIAMVSPGRTLREDAKARRALTGLDLKVRILETDVDGAVTAVMNGNSIEVRTFAGARIARIGAR